MALCFTHVIGVCCRGKDRLTEEGASFYLMDGIGDSFNMETCIGPYGTLHKGYGYNENLLLSAAPASAHTLSFMA